jgi:hypothetical protein
MLPFFASVFEKVQEGVVVEVLGGHFVEEPDVDVAGAEGEEAAVEGGFGLGCGEGGAVLAASWVAGGGVGGVGESLLEAGELLEEGAGDAAA